MIFISLNPVWASLLSVGLGEGLPRRTVGAIVLCVACVLVICSESLHATSRAGSAAGDAVALGTGGAFALYLTALRRTAQRHAAVDLSPLSSGGFLLAAAAVVGAAPLHRASGPALPPIHALPASFWLAAAVDGGLVVYFYAAVVHSSRHITAAEMAMVQLLEYVGGPIVVYAAGRSGRPSGATLCGGLLLLAGLLAHEGLGVLAERGHSLGTWCDAGLPSCGGVPRGAAALFPLGTWQELQGLVRDAEASELVAAPKGLLLHGGPRNWRPSYAPS